MIKTQTKNIKVFATCILVLCLVFFNLSCGLDIIEYYEPPYVTINPPEPENIDSNQKYILFRTNNSENTSISFKGTNVFYKIYNNREDARNERDRLKSISQNDYSGTSAETLITNYKYAMLNNSNILCPKPKSGSDDYDVRIDFTDSNKFALIIYVDGKEEQKPLRRAVENKEFNLYFHSVSSPNTSMFLLSLIKELKNLFFPTIINFTLLKSIAFCASVLSQFTSIVS